MLEQLLNNIYTHSNSKRSGTRTALTRRGLLISSYESSIKEHRPVSTYIYGLGLQSCESFQQNIIKTDIVRQVRTGILIF